MQTSDVEEKNRKVGQRFLHMSSCLGSRDIGGRSDEELLGERATPKNIQKTVGGNLSATRDGQ